MTPRFVPGQQVLYREPHFYDDRRTGAPVICDVKPVVVVEDTPALTALYLPAGTRTLMPRALVAGSPKPWGPGEWELAPGKWDRWHTLFLVVPGEWRATWVWWSPTWEFLGWYVNFQEPLWRTRWGFDIRDLQLDILVAPDRTWRWKDEDEFERGQAMGVFGDETAAKVRREASATVAAIESGAWPFDDAYRDWRPQAGWGAPTLPKEHELAPVLTWSNADALERC